MRIVQKCNPSHFFMTWLLVTIMMVMAGCVSQNPPINGIPVNAAIDDGKVIKDAAVISDEPQTSDNLSTKTVAPVGFKKFMGIFTPYRVTIQQGNFVSREMADQVKEGMTREQVRFLLGTALLTDMFHADRWDYIFRLLKPSGELITSRVTVYFENSLVAKIDRGNLPDEKEYLMRISSAAINNATTHDVGYSENP